MCIKIKSKLYVTEMLYGKEDDDVEQENDGNGDIETKPTVFDTSSEKFLYDHATKSNQNCCNYYADRRHLYG